MKILQICAYAAPYEGNFIKSLRALEQYALERGDETVYCFPEVNKTIPWCIEFEKTHKVYFVPLAKARILPRTYFILNKVFKENPDIRVAHSHFELYDIPISVIAPKEVKVFWHLHDAMGTYLNDWHKYIWKFQYKYMSKRAKLLSVSQKHKQVVIDLGFNPDNAYYYPNAIDTERVHQVDKERETKHDFIIFGWDYLRKGVDLAEQSIVKLASNISLGVVGGRITEQVVPGKYIIRNVQSNSDINAVFGSAKCFLHISRAEGLSYALLEALYSGLPVIVSDIEENQVAKNFPTAIMVKSEDVDSIAAAMESLIKVNFTMDEEKIAESRSLIEKEYSITSWAKFIYEAYQTL